MFPRESLRTNFTCVLLAHCHFCPSHPSRNRENIASAAGRSSINHALDTSALVPPSKRYHCRVDERCASPTLSNAGHKFISFFFLVDGAQGIVVGIWWIRLELRFLYLGLILALLSEQKLVAGCISSWHPSLLGCPPLPSGPPRGREGYRHQGGDDQVFHPAGCPPRPNCTVKRVSQWRSGEG
jgi:hypothetical protein